MLVAPAVAEPPLAPPEPAIAASYSDIIEQQVFSRDRHATVEAEVVSRPVPPLPVAHGVLDLGTGPTVILSESSSRPQRAYRIGDQIGELRLVGATATTIEFQWGDKRIRKTINELKPDDSIAAASQATTASASEASAIQVKVIAPPPASKTPPSRIHMDAGRRLCDPDAPTAPGAV